MTSRRVLAASLAVLAAAPVAWGVREVWPDQEISGPDRGIDARSYFEDYESGADDSGGGFLGRLFGGSSDQSAVSSSAGQSDSSATVVPTLPRVPGLLEDNVFVDAGTSGFVDTAADARSTFALDVDTGSFGVARTLLSQGRRVPPASVRVEEWVNAQTYADPLPEDGRLAVTATTGPSPSLPGVALTRIAVTAPETALEDLPPVNVVLVVDRSGSMDIRERLGLVKSSLALLADTLRDTDTVAVVSFESSVETILEPTEVRRTGRILAAIDRLRPGGSTNLVAGLERGYDLAHEAYRPGGVNAVVLASDGVANVGVTGPGSILRRITEEGRAGIHLVTVGYGMGNYNDHLMEQLADRGDGFYAYVDTFAEAQRLFARDLATILAPVASEARAQVAFDPALVTSYRQVGYDNRAIADEDFRDDSVDAGEIGGGHRVTALYELRLAEGVTPDQVVGTATVRWTPVGGGPATEETVAVLAGGGAADDDLALAGATADLAGLLKGGSAYADRAVTLEDVVARLRDLDARGVPGAAAVLEVAELAVRRAGRPG